jgi:hypothetical protein
MEVWVMLNGNNSVDTYKKEAVGVSYMNTIAVSLVILHKYPN